MEESEKRKTKKKRNTVQRGASAMRRVRCSFELCIVIFKAIGDGRIYFYCM